MDQKAMPLPAEAIHNARDDIFRALQAMLDHTDKTGDSFLYVMVRSPDRPPRYMKVLGLQQFTRVTTAIAQLIREKNANDEQLRNVAQAVANLEENARRLAEEGDKLTRWDFLKMAVFGKQPVIDSIKAKRVKAGQPYVDLDGLH